jgi:hypothetical protein
MGTCYYFGRVDNYTLFDMDKAYRIGLLSLERGVSMSSDEASIGAIIASCEPAVGIEYARELTSKIVTWAEGQPLIWLDENGLGDEWYCGEDFDERRVTGSRFDEDEDEPLFAARKAAAT